MSTSQDRTTHLAFTPEMSPGLWMAVNTTTDQGPIVTRVDAVNALGQLDTRERAILAALCQLTLDNLKELEA